MWKARFSSFLAKPTFFVFANCNFASNQKVFKTFKGFTDIQKLFRLQFYSVNKSECLLFIAAEAIKSEATTFFQVSSANVFRSSECSKFFSRSYNGIIFEKTDDKKVAKCQQWN